MARLSNFILVVFVYQNLMFYVSRGVIEQITSMLINTPIFKTLQHHPPTHQTMVSSVYCCEPSKTHICQPPTSLRSLSIELSRRTIASNQKLTNDILSTTEPNENREHSSVPRTGWMVGEFAPFRQRATARPASQPAQGRVAQFGLLIKIHYFDNQYLYLMVSFELMTSN